MLGRGRVLLAFGACGLLAVTMPRAGDEGGDRSAQAAVTSRARRPPRTRCKSAQRGHRSPPMRRSVLAAWPAGVTAPSSSGLGGGGFVMGWDSATKASLLLDFLAKSRRKA